MTFLTLIRIFFLSPKCNIDKLQPLKIPSYRLTHYILSKFHCTKKLVNTYQGKYSQFSIYQKNRLRVILLNSHKLAARISETFLVFISKIQGSAIYHEEYNGTVLFVNNRADKRKCKN